MTLLHCVALPPSPTIRVWLHELRANGFASVRFGALPEAMADTLVRQGFEPLQQLHLLDLSLVGWHEPEQRSDSHTRKLRAREHSVAARIDNQAFGSAWAIDETGIAESCAATPYHRSRVVDVDGVISGYAICGRADHEGFLQRLAVHPAAQGQGIGSALVTDSLRWMKRHRLTRAIVNTHIDNAGALSLYQGIGFRILPHGLVVLRRTLDDLA